MNMIDYCKIYSITCWCNELFNYYVLVQTKMSNLTGIWKEVMCQCQMNEINEIKCIDFGSAISVGIEN